MEVVCICLKYNILVYPVANNDSSEIMPAHHYDIFEIQNLQVSHYKQKENIFYHLNFLLGLYNYAAHSICR